MPARVSSGQPCTRSSSAGEGVIVRRLAETVEAGTKNVNSVARAAPASAATVDRIDIWSRSSRGMPPDTSTTTLSPLMLASAPSTCRSAVTVVKDVACTDRQVESACIWRFRRH